MLTTRMTLGEVFGQVAEHNSEREAIICDDSRVRYGTALDRVSALARGLRSEGIRKGDVLAASVPACTEFVYLFFAAAELGAVIAPFDPMARPEYAAHLLADSGARIVLAAERPRIEEAIGILREGGTPEADLPRILWTRREEGSELTMDGLMGAEAGTGPPEPPVQPGDRMALLYTSGTTGSPKGAIHTHRSLIAPVAASKLVREAWTRKPSLQTVGRMAKVVARYGTRIIKMAGKPQTWLPTVGCHSITGLEILLQAVLMGDTLILMPKFNPAQALQIIQRERVSIMVVVPTALAVLLRVQEREQYDLSSLLVCGTGAAPCPEHLAREVRERFGCAIHIGFGATELGGGIAGISLDDSRDVQIQTVGKPMPGMEVKIVDENRDQVSTGEVGELACRGENLMEGYFGAADRTAEVMDEDGWYYTGDLAVMDEKGYLRIVGRKKDMIIRGGQNIYPEDIEERLMSHSNVREAAVVGVPGSAGGETIWAFVILEEGQELDAKSLMAYCRDGLERYQIPDRVRFVADFPRTSLGKPKKYELRELAVSERPGSGAGTTGA